MSTASQDPLLRSKGKTEEVLYVLQKEQKQLEAIKHASEETHERDFEGGFGGQEDSEDRYATTSGEH